MRSCAILLVGLACSATAGPLGWLQPPDTSQMVVSNGYPVEKHPVVTEDGYILTLFRIPYGQNDAPSANRPALLLQHGVLCSSDCWVLSIPEKGLGYRLADAGYDVWLGNNRGTTYSMGHVNKTSDAQYWDFSFHELGTRDLPAMIDYILERTQQKQLTYVGHSQGTTQFFAMASSRPEYNDKVKVMSALAPVAFLSGTEGALHYLAKFAKSLAYVANLFGMHHVLEHSFLINIADHMLCRKDSWFRPVCDNAMYIVTGFDSPQLNKTLVEVIVQYSPSGASIKQLLHFAQLVAGDRFCQYDYGSSENVKHYGTEIPPEYNLTAITAPVILHYAKNDFIARPENVEQLSKLLGNPVAKVEVPYEQFNHIDFMWAIDINPLVYDDAIDRIKKFL